MSTVADYWNRLAMQLDLNKQCFYPLKQPDDELPGEQLGCDVLQHVAAVLMALEELPGSDYLPEDGAALVEQAERLVDFTKGRADFNTARSLVAMNLFLEQQLTFPSPLINSHHADLLQRKLVANLPAATNLVTQPDGNTDQELLRLLRCRCAIAKGRHRLEYHGHRAACDLLDLLTDQNEPSIKAVLRLHPDSKATASAEDCSGVFELNFDVRGTFIAPPTKPRWLPEVQDVDIFTLVAEAEMAIRREWDTVSFSVAVGTGPSLALEVCFIVMAHLQRDNRAACIIVGKDQGDAGRRTITLAELDPALRGLALLNSKHVLERAKRGSGAAQQGHQEGGLRRRGPDPFERLTASVTAADAVYEGIKSSWRDSGVDHIITRLGSLGNSMPQLPSFNRLGLMGMRMKHGFGE